MADDVLLNQAAAIERAVGRVREEYAGDDRNLLANQTRQDAIRNDFLAFASLLVRLQK